MSEVEHYKQRLRDLLPFARHQNECAFSVWSVAEFLQKSRGTDYSAGPAPACTCGLSSLGAIIAAEVGHTSAPETSVQLTVSDGRVEVSPAAATHCDHGLSLSEPCERCRTEPRSER